MDIAKQNRQNEIWKSPPSLDCRRVEVSNFGRVRTTDYIRRFQRLGKEATNKCKGKPIKGFRDARGRWMLMGGTIRKELNGKGLLLHRLVAECFVPNPKPEEYNMVFFKDRDVGNCRADNLVWGCRKDRNYLSRGNLAVYKIKVVAIDKVIGEYYGCGEAARALGVTKQALHNAIKEGRTCRGFQIIATKNDGTKPLHTVEEAHNNPVDEMNGNNIPDGIFSKQEVDITPKAVL